MCFFGSLIAHFIQFSSVTQSDSLRPHGLQHTKLPCLSLTPGACQPLSLLNNITQQGYTTVYLTIHLLKNILVASKFWQLGVCVSNFSVHLGKYQGVQLLDHIVTVLSFERNCYTVFQSSCTILHSH